MPSNRGFWRFGGGLAVSVSGALWVATHRGAARFPAPDSARPAKVPRPVIDTVLLNGHGILRDQRGQPRLEWPAGQGNLEIQFAVPMFADRERVRFAHRLRALNETWHETGDSGTAFFAHVPPGRYEFEVKAFGYGSPMSAQRASIALTLLPPIWQTWPFRIGMFLTGLIIIAVAIRARMRAVARKFALVTEERNRIAREIHDSLEQTLFAARFQLQVVEGTLPHAEDETPSAQQKAITRLEDLLEQGVEETRDAVWALRSGIFGRADLPTAISVSLGTVLQGHDVQFSLKTVGKTYRLVPQLEWQIGRIIREAVTNALKHAQPSNITVRLTFDSGRFCAEVEDDGRGVTELTMAEREKEGRFGLKGMRERAARMGAQFSIQSHLNKGTLITITLKHQGAHHEL
jgi:signal transduction histidine kinase